MAKKVYLVDTENVGSVWIKLLPNMPKQDEIILFFTEHSPAVSYTDLISLLEYTDRFEFVKCYMGRNGLDFQLVSYLGYMLRNAAKTEFLIVSNDIGFDSVVKFWCDRGRRVSRLNASKINAEYNRRSSPVNALPENISEANTDAIPSIVSILSDADVPVSTENGNIGDFAVSDVPVQPGGIEHTNPLEIVLSVPEDQAAVSSDEKAVSSVDDSNRVVPEISTESKTEKKTAKKNAGSASKRAKGSASEKKSKAGETVLPAETHGEEAKSLLEETLSPVIGAEEIDWAFDMLKKYDIGKDGLNVIYCEIIKHFAQEKGLNVYRRLKPIISKFYSITTPSVL